MKGELPPGLFGFGYGVVSVAVVGLLWSFMMEGRILDSLSRRPKKLTNIWLRNARVPYDVTFRALERSVRTGTARRAVQRDGAVTYALTSEGWKRRQLRHRLASSPSDQQLEGRQKS